MAKKTAKAEVEKVEGEKKVRAPREKKESYLKDNYTIINDFRIDETGIVPSGMPVRGIGVQIREEAYQDGKLVSVSSNFIPGVKIKTKKDWKYLIIDKGPKSRKSSEEDESDDDE